MGNINTAAALCACLIISIDVESKDCKKQFNFDRHPGIQLQGHMIKNMTTSHLEDCVIECGNTPGCLSINFHNTGNVIHCELNKSNRYGNRVQLVQTGYDHAYLELVHGPDWPDACFQKDGWHRRKKSAYKFVNERLPAAAARQKCQTMLAVADLVSLGDKEEEQNLDTWIEGLGLVLVHPKIWIGFSDVAKEGTFVWNDGTKSNYTNWGSTEPNNANGVEDCVTKLYQGQWNDEECSNGSPFVCEVFCQ